MLRFWIGWTVIILLAGCDPFEYHPYDARLAVKYKNINAKNLERMRANDRHSDTVRFAFIGDTQRWYDETEDFVKALNQRKDIDFVIHGGDISDFGMKKEFCWMEDILGKLNVPHVVIIGNHDHLGTGGEIYRAMYGELNFAFVYGKVKFLCMNTNALDFDYSVPVPDFEFIRREMTDSLTAGYTSTVAAMHAPPGSDVFNNNVQLVFHRYLKGYNNLRFCINAHDHNLKVNDIFGDGILYYGAAAISRRNYLLFTVLSDSYTYEVVEF